MLDSVAIDKKCFAVMKYMYRHEWTSIYALNKRFFDSVDPYVVPLICILCDANACVYKSPDGKLSFDTTHLDYSGRVALTISGKEYVEQRRFNFWRWTIPTIISVAALIVSCIALYQSFHGELFVHILPD